jgi:hypothetical protein
MGQGGMHMHTAKVEKRTYRAPGGGKRILAGVLLFVSCVLILMGLLRDGNGGLSFELKVTPTPTAIGKAFDETFVERQISLPARSWYAIQLGAYDSEESARSQAESYVARGAAGYVRKDSRFRVLAALYPTKEEAQTVRQQLQSQHQIDSYVYEIALPEILLNVKGMAGQLDVLEAGMQYLNTTLEKFCEISASMDKQDLPMEQELSRLAEIASQADTLKNVLAQRFAAVNYAVVGDLINLMKEIGQATSAVAEISSKGNVVMGAQMKYETLKLLSMVEGYLYSFGK